MTWTQSTTHSPTHLSDEELYSLLDQPQDSRAQMHLAACLPCQHEFEAVREALNGFRQSAGALAEAEFSPRLRADRQSPFKAMRRSALAWPLSLAAAALVCGASLSLVHHSSNPGMAAHASPAIPSQVSESDDALLDGISQDLATSVAPSLQPLSVTAEIGTSLTHN